MPFGISGAGNLADDVKQAKEIVEIWRQARTQGENVSWKQSVNGAVPDELLMIPKEVIDNCYGICFLFYVKAGFVFSGELGTGFVIKKLNKGTPEERWSGPSAVTSGGMGWGLQIGAQKTYHVVFLNFKEDINVFGDKAKVNFGGDVGVTVGPLGRQLDAKANLGTGGVSVNYAYSWAKGLFGGLALNGAICTTNPAMNKGFYNKDFTARDILDGRAGDKKYKMCDDLKDVYHNLDVLQGKVEDSLVSTSSDDYWAS